MRPLLCSPPAYPYLTRLEWEHAALQSCLQRLLQALDMVTVTAAPEPEDDLLAAVARAWLLVGDPWHGAEDMWLPLEGDSDVRDPG